MGVMITSAAVVIYPHMKMEEFWDPMKLVGQFHSVAVVAISMFTVVVATLAVNIAANVVSPANDFANAFPIDFVSYRRTDYWNHRDPDAAVALAGRSFGLHFCLAGRLLGGLGSIAGVLIADYWIVREKRLALAIFIDQRRLHLQWRLELAGDCRDLARLRIGLDWIGGIRAEAAV